jgi:hypothetical protein
MAAIQPEDRRDVQRIQLCVVDWSTETDLAAQTVAFNFAQLQLCFQRADPHTTKCVLIHKVSILAQIFFRRRISHLWKHSNWPSQAAA